MRQLRRRRPKRAYVSPESFRDNLNDFYQRATLNGTQVLSVTIAPSTKQLRKSNPPIDGQIALYNQIYEDVASEYPAVTLMDPYADAESPDAIMIDHVHPNAKGHQLIYEHVAAKL